MARSHVSEWLCLLTFLKNGPIPASFCLFSSFSHYNFNNTNWKKRSWCAWDSNTGQQDGRRRQNHGAMALLTLVTKKMLLKFLTGDEVYWSQAIQTYQTFNSFCDISTTLFGFGLLTLDPISQILQRHWYFILRI